MQLQIYWNQNNLKVNLPAETSGPSEKLLAVVKHSLDGTLRTVGTELIAHPDELLLSQVLIY